MRFEFGNNWKKYAINIDERRIISAETSLTDMLGIETIQGKPFLDAGCGSGLFSLAAVRLGARKVHSFDFDENSVNTTKSVKETFAPDANNWIIERGDILDKDYLQRTGKHDIVYSWGVLHHTGDMWKAIENAASNVAENGILFISIYNDQGMASNAWRLIKKAYNALPGIAKGLVLYPVFIRIWLPTFIRDFIKLKPFTTWKSYRENAECRHGGMLLTGLADTRLR